MEDAASIPQVDSGNDDASDKEVFGMSDDASVSDASPEGEASPSPSEGSAEESRAAPRFTLLIRAAKLVSAHGEFVCVIRDVSETGVSVRMFHHALEEDDIELHMPGGGEYPLKRVWEREREAGFEFAEKVDVAQLINEASEYPKRGMRLGLVFPISIRSLTGSAEGVVENLSQQGARFSSEGLFAIDQTVRLSAEENEAGLPEVRAKVRWRRDDQYGVVFDDTLSLSDFARLAARIQCPSLLD